MLFYKSIECGGLKLCFNCFIKIPVDKFEGELEKISESTWQHTCLLEDDIDPLEQVSICDRTVQNILLTYHHPHL